MRAHLPLVRESEVRGANKKGTGKCVARTKKGYYVCLRSSRVSLKTQLVFEKGLSLLTLCKNCTQPGTVQTVSAGNFRISLLEETL